MSLLGERLGTLMACLWKQWNIYIIDLYMCANHTDRYFIIVVYS